ncbi:MAG: PH domain-containing protein [Patescibacteria group bacterium]
MFNNRFNRKLKADEEIIAVIKQYPLTQFWSYLFSLGLVVLAFFLLYPLLQWGLKGMAVLIVLAGGGVLLTVRKFLVWSLNVFLITSRRIIDFNQLGLFYCAVTEVNFENVQDISYNKKGICPTIFNYGDIVVKTASNQSNLEFVKVHYPADVQQIIVDTQINYNTNIKNK